MSFLSRLGLKENTLHGAAETTTIYIKANLTHNHVLKPYLSTFLISKWQMQLIQLTDTFYSRWYSKISDSKIKVWENKHDLGSILMFMIIIDFSTLLLLNFVCVCSSSVFVLVSDKKATCQKTYWCLYGSCQYAYIYLVLISMCISSVFVVLWNIHPWYGVE